MLMTLLLVSDSNIDNIRNQLSKEVANCYQWMTNNKLSMHMGKTKLIVFSSRRRQYLSTNFHIKCQDNVIKSSDKIKYLGLYLEQSLAGDHTVNSIIGKCALIGLKFMYRHSKALNERSRKLLASALIRCHFDYSACAWYEGVTTKLKTRLQIAQNKMVRWLDCPR